MGDVDVEPDAERLKDISWSVPFRGVAAALILEGHFTPAALLG